MYIYIFIAMLIISYLVGSVSNARIISKLFKTDITKQGSGNPGTMNMLRTLGFKAGILTLILDVLKSASMSLIAYFVFKNSGVIDSVVALYSCGLAVVIGHNFPIYYKFKGGKGVACILGIYAVAQPIWALVVFVCCFVYLLIFDYGAIASFIFITVLTVIEALQYRNLVTVEIIIAILFFLTIFMHRGNINRMLTGTERKANIMKHFKKLTKKEKKKYKIKEIG